ncbi:hypothetical protein BASA50_005244 [Batrachochytrium salamandrivorans]|uniref:DUF1003 domain-containing protein n=1 Tax=Batrachochytrium salamandrivorans TaxID=1357716 RepID=A0ABQ8FD45_9FUNG|nr:hypothetical protein BASA60_009686 [Batrachochytrium salamandrivorans]KAH6573636.1 hypothetical protein BASA62_002850 [Batrachochytrium salamandrivorans]KAH6596203.1 hypothetical protein BASA50_005244 [Batrachochytrium salamandrivorans]KAH6600171.1 hypothetical protein BASA61_002352 [Batrachochytrium salamandrivorans]KAH9272067.1 hypothetical protein BASA83_005655 [Batrachochytrium salamandrivorans]
MNSDKAAVSTETVAGDSNPSAALPMIAVLGQNSDNRSNNKEALPDLLLSTPALDVSGTSSNGPIRGSGLDIPAVATRMANATTTSPTDARHKKAPLDALLHLHVPAMATVVNAVQYNDSFQCAVCRRHLPRSADTWTVIADIKPRFLRLLQKDWPLAPLDSPTRRICHDHVQNVLQGRIDFLLQEDQSQFSQLQEDAIKNIKSFEIEQSNWQSRFDLKRTMGQIAADAVARFGGSWGFLGSLGAFLLIWAVVNLILAAYGPSDSAWDPYPFILLNLFLSMLAATQAPIIMMSQNRQAERDRLQTNFVAEAILNNEHQTRLVDAKIDHLLSYQWKRLLEIQEIQIHLLELQIRHPDSIQPKLVHHFSSPKANEALLASPSGIYSARTENLKESWSVEIQSDHLTKMLLRHYFDADLPGDNFVMTHWHEDGDNFSGSISDVVLDIIDRRLTQITFTLNFSEHLATMDDVFSGEGTVHLRNDFNIPHMHHYGRIAQVRAILSSGVTISFLNGELPPRYKPTFARKREERITEIWKAHIRRLTISYVPPLQVAIIDVDEGYVLRRVTASIFPRPNGTIPNTSVFMAVEGHPDTVALPQSVIADANLDPVSATPTAVASLEDIRIDNPIVYCRQMVGPRPLSAECWKQVVDFTWEPATLSGTGNDSTQLLQRDRRPSRTPSLIRLTQRHSVDKPATSATSSTSIGDGPTPLKNDGGSAVTRSAEVTFDDVRSDVIIATAPACVDLGQEFAGPATFVFMCDDSRVCFHGDIEKSIDRI